MSNILIGGALRFSEVNTPTREGELINTISEIYNIPTPRLGMWVYVKDERKMYIVKSLKSKVIDGVIVDDAGVESYEPIIADGVKNGAITRDMLNVSLRAALEVVDSLNDNDPNKPLSARQGYLLKQMINALDGSDTSLEEFTDFLSSIENDITALDGKIAALSAGLKLTLTASPSVIHKGVKTTITLKGSVADNAGAVTADRMVVVTSAGEVAQDNVSSLTAADEITTNNSSVQFGASAICNGISLSAKAAVSARYPVYAGMGATPEDIAIGTTYRQAATTTAVGKTYSATAKADNVYFFLLVPTEVSQPSSFYMGGSPFTMNPAYTKRIGVVEFKIYQSGAVYDTGASVNVETK